LFAPWAVQILLINYVYLFGFFGPLLWDVIPSPFITLHADGFYPYTEGSVQTSASSRCVKSELEGAHISHTPSIPNDYILNRYLVTMEQLPSLLVRANKGHTLPYYSIPKYHGGEGTGPYEEPVVPTPSLLNFNLNPLSDRDALKARFAFNDNILIREENIALRMREKELSFG
jgi:hypothetical protein